MKTLVVAAAVQSRTTSVVRIAEVGGSLSISTVVA